MLILVLVLLLVILFFAVVYSDNKSYFGKYPYSEECGNDYSGNIPGSSLLTEEEMNKLLNNYINNGNGN